jgi:DNA-binding NarL/FixJ family response regulator
MRRSLAQVLECEPDVDVVGEAPDGGAAVQLAADLEPDVVVMDVGMPQVNGVDATRRILAQCPRIRVIGLSVHSSRDYAARMMRAGARAYVLKDGGGEELLAALQVVRQGRIYLSLGIDSCGS